MESYLGRCQTPLPSGHCQNRTLQQASQSRWSYRVISGLKWFQRCPVKRFTYMKHVVIVSTHFRETDQLKLEERQNMPLRKSGPLFVRIFRIVRPIPIHDLYIIALLWITACSGGKRVPVRCRSSQRCCAHNGAV
jgi:hypothetical protein